MYSNCDALETVKRPLESSCVLSEGLRSIEERSAKFRSNYHQKIVTETVDDPEQNRERVKD